MTLKIDKAELIVTNDLLADYAVDTALTAEEVYKTSWKRYNTLHQLLVEDIFSDKDNNHINIYAFLPKLIHGFIYRDLFTFAGQYRLKKDPRKGVIYFGIQHGHKQTPKYMGDSPESIEEGITDAISYLFTDSIDPLYQAIRFYQKFINVHPFYDANGRIARLIATIYLDNYNLVLDWSEFSGKKKFFKKLNRCHDLPNNKTFSRLTNYLRAFSYTINSIEDIE